MDLQPDHQQQQQSTPATQIQTLFPDAAQNTDTHTQNPPLRSSARVKAAKQKEKVTKEGAHTDEQSPSTSTSTRANAKQKRTRDTGKGKARETLVEPTPARASKRTRRATAPAAAPLTINEPAKDPKGKKRAHPEPASDEDDTAAAASASPKRLRTASAYSLRSKTETPAIEMTRKTRVTNTKGKMSVKGKAVASASTSRIEDDDVEMADATYKRTDSDGEAEPQPGAAEAEEERDDDDEDHGDDDDDEGDGDGDGGDDGMPSAPDSGGAFDGASAMAMFGDQFQFGSFVLGLPARLKGLLNNIKATADPTTRLVSLQELSEVLSMTTEDTLTGSFQVEQFVREFVRILGGRGAENDEDEGGDGGQEPDEDAALAAALAMSGGGTYQGDENLEAQVLACRCLANLMEALPGVAHTVVYHGAIPVLCSKLIEISYIDLAEQTLSTLEKISEEFPSAIVREGGLAALLNYLDFFSIAVQRTALQAASNCCRNVAAEHFPMIRGVWPIIRNCMSYSDQRLVEFACVSVIRVIDSYHRSSIENLEQLVDTDLVRAVNLLLLPAGGSPLIAANTYTLLLRALATCARASPKITLTLLEADFVVTLYQILTGVLPPSSSGEGEEQGGAAGGQGLGGGLADMTVMENLAHRPKEQVEEALSLASELMPSLPKDGVFDHKAYTEKSLARMIKAKGKAERAAARQAAAAAIGLLAPQSSSPAPTPPAAAESSAAVDTSMSVEGQPADGEDAGPAAKPVIDRTELLRSKPEVVGRFMHLMVPILIDVYAASVITPVRVKTLTGLLKAISFLDSESLKKVLTYVPVASFASSILSSKDHPSLVIGALQLVDLLLTKLPDDYKPVFRREGVVHEIEALANRVLASSKSKEKEKDKESGDTPSPGESGPSAAPPASAASTASAIPGFKKLSSLSLEPDDAITLRARVIRFKHLSDGDQKESNDTLASLKKIGERLSSSTASEKDSTDALKQLAELFVSPRSSVSSFELLQSGAVDALLHFATNEGRKVSVSRRQEIFMETFATRKAKTLAGATSPSPLGILVKKLQESLTRMESFDVITVSQGIDDSKRSSPSLLARQLRLRLVADDTSDMPRNLHNMVVSIHAIATFQALHDYLRPRVSGLLSSGLSSALASRGNLSGMLAALSAAGLTPASSSRAAASEIARGPPSPAPPMAPPASTDAQDGGETSSSSGTVTRRRSQRLSARNSGSSLAEQNDALAASAAESSSDAMEAASATDATVGGPSAVPTSAATAGSDSAAGDALLEDGGLGAEFPDDEVDAEVFDDEVDPDTSMPEKTAHISVADDGSKVEAQTPEGTRVATPAVPTPTPTPRQSLQSRASYASALKAKPSDWHLEFSMDDHILPVDMTIYGAIHQHEMRKKSGALPPSLMWQGVYTVKFKKVPGPAPLPADARAEGAETGTKNRSQSPMLTSLPEDSPHSKILRLLRVLHRLNSAESERTTFTGERRTLPESAFVNNKLTAKLTRQLEEPMIVASSCLPDWALDLPQHFPFLFPFATRYNFLQSTSFGYARLILKWQSQQNRGQDTSRREDSIGFLGRLQRQKVRISRKHILESAVKVFELYGSSSSVLEVEYFEEVGTGLGPTLEFYSLASKEFARRDLKIWRDSDQTHPGAYVLHPRGLFPAPLSTADISNDGGQKRTHIFRVIGQFVAKAMLDSRIIDLSLNKVFLKLALGEEIALTIANLKLVDLELGNSLAKLQNMVAPKNILAKDKLLRKVQKVESVSVDDLYLDFTIPGYDIELRPGGRDIAVTSANVDEYIREVIDAIIGQGAQRQAKAFREGFSKVFPITDLQAFSADELEMLFGNSDEDWSIETLSEVIKADHGFNVESRAIRDLLDIMSDYDEATRRDFLQFITGSPKLPIGGFRGLNPALTVVRKPHEPPLTANDYLPSVMTCVNYLKLPEYSSKAVMREKLAIAIKEGVGSFHLS